MSHKSDRRAIEKLDALYAQLPRVACRGLCGEACGPVPMSTLEAQRLKRADPQRRLPMVDERARCCYLTAREQCSVYAVRPLICRVWGVVKRMSCPHGCVPDRWLTDHEFLAVAQAVERIGGPIVLSALHALDSKGDSFFDVDGRAASPEFAEYYAEITRSQRALHGGRIVAVTPGDGSWVDLDRKR